ncbi:hypothetical protein JT358_15450 [Micrococcales bacterium 31B]|nr:hypothetical protein [Micrococcales bacterium 31B]
MSLYQNNLAISIQAPLTNEKLTTTGWFQVVNSSSAAFPMTVKLTGTDSVATAFTVTAWPITNTAACTDQATVGPGAVTGTLNNLTLANRLPTAAGASNYFCVRYTVPERQLVASPQGNTVTPGIRADFALEDTGWSGVSGQRAALFSTSGIYPGDTTTFKPNLSSNYNLVSLGSSCLAPSGASTSTTVGTALITLNCLTSPRQGWAFVPVNPADPSLFTLRLHQNILRTVAQWPNGTLALGELNPSDPWQQWRLQILPDGRRLLVNQASGKCLGLTTVVATPLYATTCTNVASTGVGLYRVPLAVTYQPGTSTSPLIGIILPGGAAVANSISIQHNVAGTWIDVPSWQDGFRRRFDASGFTAGNHEIRILNGLNQVVDQGTMDVVPTTPLLGGGSITGVARFDPPYA